MVMELRGCRSPTRGMRLAGAGSSSPLQPVVALSNMRENALARPLSVEAPDNTHHKTL